MYYLAFKLTSFQEDAEEIAQETMAKAARSIHTFRGESNVKTWLWRIGINTSHDFMRRRKRNKDRIAALKENISKDDLVQRDREPDGFSDTMLEALNTLPEKQREALVLTECEDISHKEAAKILGCTTNTVSWRVFSAKGKLQKYFKKRGSYG